MGQWDGLNRRNFPRAKYPCLVVLKTGGNADQRFLAHTENVGVGGLCIIVKENVKMFSEVKIELDLMDLEEHVCCSGKIVWNVQRKNDETEKPLFYDIGIEFQNLTDEELARITKIVDMIAQKVEDQEKPSE